MSERGICVKCGGTGEVPIGFGYTELCTCEARRMRIALDLLGPICLLVAMALGIYLLGGLPE